MTGGEDKRNWNRKEEGIEERVKGVKIMYCHPKMKSTLKVELTTGDEGVMRIK